MSDLRSTFSAITAVMLVLIIGSMSSVAQVKLQRNKTLQTHYEVIDDEYLPNAYGSKKTTPPYYYGSRFKSKSISTEIFTIQVNINSEGQNIGGDAANEPSIAINPLNSNEIVIGWRQFDNVTSNFRQAGKAYTMDGGLNWTFTGVLQPGIFRSDPVLDSDVDGNFYYNSLTQDSGSLPTDPSLFSKVFKSSNGGVDWDTGTEAKGGDKQWMVIDQTVGEGKGNIYSFWTSSTSMCRPGFFTRSTDGNNSYEDCIVVAGYPHWGTMAIGNDGEVLIAGAYGKGIPTIDDGLVLSKSRNAKYKEARIIWEAPSLIYLDGLISVRARVNPEGILGQVYLDVDHSDGPGSGNIYVLASVPRYSNTDPSDVMFVRSTDGGLTWSDPIRINDDNSTSHFQWFGTMSVAPNGRIDVAWLDTRDSPIESDSSALYYSYSVDQGLSWSANERLSELFDPHIGYPNQNKLGDYFDMISDNKGAHLAWANTFNGEQDVCYSYIVPPVLVGINEKEIIKPILIFPNPTNGYLEIRGLAGHAEIEVFNLIGERLMSISSYNSGERIDISSQPSGLYFIKISERTRGSIVRKLIKE